MSHCFLLISSHSLILNTESLVIAFRIPFYCLRISESTTYLFFPFFPFPAHHHPHHLPVVFTEELPINLLTSYLPHCIPLITVVLPPISISLSPIIFGSTVPAPCTSPSPSSHPHPPVVSQEVKKNRAAINERCVRTSMGYVSAELTLASRP